MDIEARLSADELFKSIEKLDTAELERFAERLI